MESVKDILDSYAKLYALSKFDSAYDAALKSTKEKALKMLKINIESFNIFSDLEILHDENLFNEAKKIMLDQIKFKIKDVKKGKAVLVFVKDATGSMGSFENAIGESLFKWTEFFFREAYGAIEIKYVTFNTDAKAASKQEFYGKSEGGGTIVSSGLKVANDILYDYNGYDKYVFLFSDGDNLTSDCERCAAIVKDIEQKAPFKYIEINQYNRQSVLVHWFRNKGIDFNVLRGKGDIPDTLNKMVETITE